MIRHLLIGLVVGACSVGAARASDFEVLIDLPKGATIDLVVDRSREDVRKGQTTRTAGVFRYRQTLVPTRDGYRVRQRMTGMEGGAMREATDIAAAAADLSWDTDEALTPTAFLDWPATVERMMDAFGKASPGAPVPALDGVRKMFLAMPPRQAATVMLKEQAFLAVPQMASLDLGKPLTVPEALPNPLGGPPIASSFTLKLVSLDKTSGRAVVRSRQALDPASAIASMRKTFEVMAANAGAPAPTEAEMARLGMERTTTCRYDMDLKTGLTAKADCGMKTVMSTGDETATRDERWVIAQTLVSMP